MNVLKLRFFQVDSVTLCTKINIFIQILDVP